MKKLYKKFFNKGTKHDLKGLGDYPQNLAAAGCQDDFKDVNIFQTLKNIAMQNISHNHWHYNDNIGYIPMGMPFHINDLMDYRALSYREQHRQQLHMGIQHYAKFFNTDKASLRNLIDVAIITPENTLLSLSSDFDNKTASCHLIKIGCLLFAVQPIEFNHALHQRSPRFLEPEVEAVLLPEISKARNAAEVREIREKFFLRTKYLIPHVFPDADIPKIVKGLNKLYSNQESVLMTLLDIDPVDIQADTRLELIESIVAQIPRHYPPDMIKDFAQNVRKELSQNGLLRQVQYYEGIGIASLRDSIAPGVFLRNLERMKKLFEEEVKKMPIYFVSDASPLDDQGVSIYKPLEFITIKTSDAQPAFVFTSRDARSEDVIYRCFPGHISQSLVCAQLNKLNSYYGHCVGFRSYNNNPYLVVRRDEFGL